MDLINIKDKKFGAQNPTPVGLQLVNWPENRETTSLVFTLRFLSDNILIYADGVIDHLISPSWISQAFYLFFNSCSVTFDFTAAFLKNVTNVVVFLIAFVFLY